MYHYGIHSHLCPKLYSLPHKRSNERRAQLNPLICCLSSYTTLQCLFSQLGPPCEDVLRTGTAYLGHSYQGGLGQLLEACLWHLDHEIVPDQHSVRLFTPNYGYYPLHHE